MSDEEERAEEERLMGGLPEPTDGCEACVAYRAEILRLRSLVATPLTMLSNALDACLYGMYSPALWMIEEWIAKNSEEDDGDEQQEG